MARTKKAKSVYPIKKETKENVEVKDVQTWIDRIDKAKKVKENWREQFRIALAYDYRDGKQRPPETPANEWITVNRIYSNLMAELPTLYSNDPYFYIKLAKSFSSHPMQIALMETKGKIRQSMLNYLKGELQIKQKVRLSILDAYFQYGVEKNHYTADVIDNPDKGKPVMDDEGAMVYSEAGEAIAQPDTLPANEAYKVSRVHPDDFTFDADAGPLEDDWSYLFQKIRMPQDEMKKNKKYNATFRRAVKPTEIEADKVEKEREERKKGSSFEPGNQPKPTIVVLYECYDLKKKEWCVVSPGCREYYAIDPGPVPKGTEVHPYNILRLGLLRDDSPYPIPPVSQWLDPQRETNELRSKILTHRKRFNRKYEVWEEALDDTEMTKLEVGADGTILKKKQPQQAVIPIQDASLDQNHIQELIMLRNDFEELATGANQMGGGAGVDSATEAGIIEKRVVVREGDRMSQVMDFVKGIGRKLDQLVKAHITRDQAVKVRGPEGEYWELVRASDYDDIAGEYEYSVNVGSTIPQLPEIERAQWLSFLQLLANAPHLALSPALLKSMAEKHHIEDEQMINELYNIAKQMMGGQLPMPGRQGSLPGTTDAMTRPASVTGGMAMGINNVRGGAQ